MDDHTLVIYFALPLAPDFSRVFDTHQAGLSDTEYKSNTLLFCKNVFSVMLVSSCGVCESVFMVYSIAIWGSAADSTKGLRKKKASRVFPCPYQITTSGGSVYGTGKAK